MKYFTKIASAESRKRKKLSKEYEKALGSGYSGRNIRPYLRDSGIKAYSADAAADVKKMYDSTEQYQALQKPLMQTAPGSKEEKAYLAKNQTTLDKVRDDNLKSRINASKKYGGPESSRKTFEFSLKTKMPTQMVPSYMAANKYVYSRASYNGVSNGWSPRKEGYDPEHYTKVIYETDAAKKYKMIVNKYPDSKAWLDSEGGVNYIRRHRAGQ